MSDEMVWDPATGSDITWTPEAGMDAQNEDELEDYANVAVAAAAEAQASATAAGLSETAAGASATAAGLSAAAASASETAAGLSETAAAGSASAALAAQGNAETAETGAEAAEALAEKWATELEDVVVADSKYSAFHWAQKAEEFASAGSGTVTSVDLTPGTGISVSGGPITTSGSITVTNTAPDQTVVLTQGANVTITGTYPSFTIAATDTNTTYTGGTGIDLVGTEFAIDSTVATLTGTQTLTNKTLTAPTMTGAVLNDGFTEEVFAVTGTTPALSPTNGSIQTWTLSGNSTPTAGTWAAGQSITLMIDDGSAFTVTWTTLAVVWKTDGGSAPTLNTTGFTVIALWKVGSTIYGARVGDA
jgi:hypothetical protein